jgi:hypothetical protein
LGGKLAQAEVARLAGKDPNSFTAYDYLMRGWYEWHKFTRESNAAARDLFEQARKIDPNYARAYAGLAWAYADDYDYEWTEDFEKTLKLTLEMAQVSGSSILLPTMTRNGRVRSRWRVRLSRNLDRRLAQLLQRLQLKLENYWSPAYFGQTGSNDWQPKGPGDRGNARMLTNCCMIRRVHYRCPLWVKADIASRPRHNSKRWAAPGLVRRT